MGEATAHIAAALRTSPEGQEGLRAFLEKRAATLPSGATWGVYSGEQKTGQRLLLPGAESLIRPRFLRRPTPT